jgi:hypothetical protein
VLSHLNAYFLLGPRLHIGEFTTELVAPASKERSLLLRIVVETRALESPTIFLEVVKLVPEFLERSAEEEGNEHCPPRD